MSTPSTSARKPLSLPPSSTSSLCHEFKDPFWHTPFPQQKPKFPLVDFLISKYPDLAAHYRQCTDEGIPLSTLAKRKLSSFLQDFFPNPATILTLQDAGLTVPQFMVFLALVDLGAQQAADHISFPGNLRNTYSHAYASTLFATYRKPLNLPEDERLFSFLFMQEALREYLQQPFATSENASAAAFIMLKQSQTHRTSYQTSLSLLFLYHQITCATVSDTRTRFFMTDSSRKVSIGSQPMEKILGLRPEYAEKIRILKEALETLDLPSSQTSSDAPSSMEPKAVSEEEHCFHKMRFLPFRVYYLWKKNLTSFPELSPHPKNPTRFSHYLMKFALINTAMSSIVVQQSLRILSEITALLPMSSATLALMSARNHYVVERPGDALKAKIPPMHEMSTHYVGFNDPKLWKIRVFPINHFHGLAHLNPTRPFTALQAMLTLNPFTHLIPHDRLSLHHFLCVLSAWKSQNPEFYQQILSPDSPRTRNFVEALTFLKKGLQHPSNGVLDAIHQHHSACTSCEADSSQNRIIVKIIDELITFLSTGEDKKRVPLFAITHAQLCRLENDLKFPYRHLAKESTWMHTATTLRQLKQWNSQLFKSSIEKLELGEWKKAIHKEYALLEETMHTALRLIQHPFIEQDVQLIRGPLENTFDLMNEKDSRFFSNLNLLCHRKLARFASKSLSPPQHLFADFSPQHIQDALRFYRKHATLWPHLLKRFLNAKLFQFLHPEEVKQENLNLWILPLEHELRDLHKGYRHLMSAFSDDSPTFSLTSSDVRAHIQHPLPILLGSTTLIPLSRNQKAYVQHPAPLSAHAWNVIFVEDLSAEHAIRALLPPEILEGVAIHSISELNTGGVPLTYGPHQMNYVKQSIPKIHT